MSTGTHVVRQEIFGQPTDFLIETTAGRDAITIKVTTVAPNVVRRGNHFVSFPPPLYPWPDVKDAT